ncbi:MAG: M99 family carboxypeptidase catalytic domain-containing protein [Campylobacterota bacterium]|nr:M99 family carboxypeptidase catalytic domain-containing protein [Campylobacterota bacterium]
MIKKTIIFFILIVSIVLFTACNEKNETHKQTQIKEISKEEAQVKKEISPVVLEKEEIQVKVKKESITKEIKTIPSYPQKELNRISSIATKKTIDNFDFDLIKMGYKDDNTLLIVGGIQGDEPGGFMAASLISTHYTIKKGSVWIVPNLNFYSIIKRSRGPYGDMNRKFANLSKSDPEYKTIQRIKSYISDDSVKLVVNLHDGSGFYRPTYIDKNHSQYKWGQCSIIDQEKLDIKEYANLADISKKVVKHVNKSLIDEEHIYHLHNTRTVEGDKEMEKTLTYYAINQGKSAFGNEASKSLPTHQRVYYHLLALEKYMDIMGIEFERKFDLSDKVVKNILDNDINISIYDGKIKLPLAQIRNYLNYFPVKTDGSIDFIPSNPLMSIVRNKNEYTIYYGNRRISRLNADYIDIDNSVKTVKLNIDSNDKHIEFGTKVKVDKDFMVYSIKDYKINVVGYTDKTKKDTNVLINYEKMLKRFSIDKKGSTYRVEFYTKNKFVGMILVEFAG